MAGLLGIDGDSVYAGGLIYGPCGTSINPAGPSLVNTWDNEGLILPFPDLQEVLILGGIPSPGYSVFSFNPVLSLHDMVTGQRLWSVPLPMSFGGNHGPMIRWGTNGVAVREQPYLRSDPAPGVDLFRLNLPR